MATRTFRSGLPVAVALVVVWLIVYPQTPDLAAQVYRVGLFHQLGFAVWDEHWYAGHHLPGYSLLLPPLAALLGLRLVAALSVLVSTFLFGRLAWAWFGPRAWWGGAWFAVAAVGDIWSGRVTFALGVPFALAAVLVFAGRRSSPADVSAPRSEARMEVRTEARTGAMLVAGALAALCAAASPVAGALLGLAGLTYSLHVRSLRAVLVLAVPAAAVVLPLALLFPEGGVEPFPVLSFAATVLVVGAFLIALPSAWPLLRLGGVVYLLACIVCLVVPSPVGSNVERYAVLLAGPLLLCALARDGAWARGRSTAVAGAALCAIAVWVVWGPARETKAVAGNASTRASYYAPVIRFLASHGGALERVEVPLTRSHWEAALLAPRVSLARGWEKQLDTRFDDVLLEPGLTAAGYGRWLREEAVSYVALPDTPLDPSSAQEGRLIRRGLPFLRAVFTSRHWVVYAVRDPTPLLAGPGRLTSLGHDSFALRASAPGRFLVRVRYTRYWTLTGGDGHVAEAPGGWTYVTVSAPGQMRVAARFSAGRALG